MVAAGSVVWVARLSLTREDGQRRVCAAELRAQFLPELLEHVIVRLLARIAAVILLRDRPQIPFHRCPERHVPSLGPPNVSMSSIVAQNATSWMSACAEKHPSHGKKVLGGTTNQATVLTRVR